jgi:hypothetical protein
MVAPLESLSGSGRTQPACPTLGGQLRISLFAPQVSPGRVERSMLWRVIRLDFRLKWPESVPLCTHKRGFRCQSSEPA